MKKCYTLHFRIIELLPNNTDFSKFIPNNKIFRELLLKHADLFRVNIKLKFSANYYQYCKIKFFKSSYNIGIFRALLPNYKHFFRVHVNRQTFLENYYLKIQTFSEFKLNSIDIFRLLTNNTDLFSFSEISIRAFSKRFFDKAFLIKHFWQRLLIKFSMLAFLELLLNTANLFEINPTKQSFRSRFILIYWDKYNECLFSSLLEIFDLHNLFKWASRVLARLKILQGTVNLIFRPENRS